MGKTELARALAELMFDDERARVQLDMSEIVGVQVERLRAKAPAAA